MKVGGGLIGKICDERYNYVLDEFGKNLVLLEIIKQSNKLEMLSWTHQVKTLKWNFTKLSSNIFFSLFPIPYVLGFKL